MHWWRRQSLRVQLVLITVVLGAAALVVAGGVAAAALRGYLTGQVDEQLQQFAVEPGPRGADPLMRGGPRPFGEPGARPNPDVPGEFYVQYRSGAGTVQVLSQPLGDGTPDVPAMSQAQAADLAGQPFTVAATTGGGSWRLVVAPTTAACWRWPSRSPRSTPPWLDSWRSS